MTPRKKTVLLWTLAFVLTLSIAVFQRLTGPTHPVRGRLAVEGEQATYRFLRSQTAHTPLPVAVRIPSRGLTATLNHRRFATGEEWSRVSMPWQDGAFSAKIAGQPPAGKIEYFVVLKPPTGNEIRIPAGPPVVARFKGAVPATVLIAHIVFMFAGILLVVRTGLEALRPGSQARILPWITLAVMVLGGLWLGPLVQKYAFGHYWTGFPLGSDLTDTKVLVATVVWIAAVVWGKSRRVWLLMATLVWLGIYLIPHSTLGSELDYRTGTLTNVHSAPPPPPRPEK